MVNLDTEAMQTIFITFGAGKTGRRKAARRLGKEATKTNLFKQVHVLDEKWLIDCDTQVYKQIQSYRSRGLYRGFGYWAWKPAILRWANNLYPNDQILYMDGGSHISSKEQDRRVIQQLLDSSINNHGLAWELNSHKEVEWCKKEVLEKLDKQNKYYEEDQLQASYICLPPSNKREKFIKEFYNLALEDGGFNFSDEIRVKQFDRFIEHRHDQSNFSLLWKKYKFGNQPDLTYPPSQNQFPILTTRNNTGLNVNAPKICFKIAKIYYFAIDRIFSRR